MSLSPPSLASGLEKRLHEATLEAQALALGNVVVDANAKTMVAQHEVHLQSMMTHEAGVEIEKSSHVLEIAKRDTDTAHAAVATLSSELSASKAELRKRTMEHAESVNLVSELRMGHQVLTEKLLMTERIMSQTLTDTQLARQEADTHRVQITSHKSDLTDKVLEEEHILVQLSKLEAELEGKVSVLSSTRNAFTEAEERERQAITRLSMLAEASGACKAKVTGYSTQLNDTLTIDKLNREAHGETQHMVSVLQTEVTEQDLVTAAEEAKLQELIKSLRQQEIVVAGERDAAMKKKQCLASAQEQERRASEKSLQSQRDIHKLEDVLSIANMEFEKVLQEEKEVSVMLNPLHHDVETLRTSFTSLAVAVDGLKEECLRQQANAKETTGYRALLTNKTATLTVAEGAAEEKLKLLENKLRATADEAELQRTELAALTIECNNGNELETKTALNLAQHEERTRALAASLSDAEMVLQQTALNERNSTSAHLSACQHLEEHDKLLSEAQGMMRRSQAAYLDASRSLDGIPIPVPRPLSAHTIPVPAPVSRITSPTRL